MDFNNIYLFFFTVYIMTQSVLPQSAVSSTHPGMSTFNSNQIGGKGGKKKRIGRPRKPGRPSKKALKKSAAAKAARRHSKATRKSHPKKKSKPTKTKKGFFY
jgi:hypothetical protein